MIVGSQRTQIFGKPLPRSACHAGDLADLVAKFILGLLIDASLGDPEAEHGGESQHDDDNPNDLP